MDLLLILAVIILFTMLFINLVRGVSKETLEDMPEGERRGKIVGYFLMGILVPLPVFFFIYGVIQACAGWMEETFSRDGAQLITWWVIGTPSSMTGLPFIIKALRLIRSDKKALSTAYFLGPYGIVLWFATCAGLLMLFSRGCC